MPIQIIRPELILCYCYSYKLYFVSPEDHPGSILTSLGRWNWWGDGQYIDLEDILRTLAAHHNDILRTSVGPKMVAISSENMFSKNV